MTCSLSTWSKVENIIQFRILTNQSPLNLPWPNQRQCVIFWDNWGLVNKRASIKVDKQREKMQYCEINLSVRVTTGAVLIAASYIPAINNTLITLTTHRPVPSSQT